MQLGISIKLVKVCHTHGKISIGKKLNAFRFRGMDDECRRFVL